LIGNKKTVIFDREDFSFQIENTLDPFYSLEKEKTEEEERMEKFTKEFLCRLKRAI
jgi:ribosomal protein L31